MDLMWFLMLGHLIGDYALQSDHMAREKGSSLRTLTHHVALYVLTLFGALWLYGRTTDHLSVWSVRVLCALAALFAVHWLQDFVKSRFFGQSRQAYYLDQTLHVIQLFVLRWWLV